MKYELNSDMKINYVTLEPKGNQGLRNYQGVSVFIAQDQQRIYSDQSSTLKTKLYIIKQTFDKVN